MKVPYKLSREEFRAYLFSRVESQVNELAGKRLGLNKADVDFIESIRKADRRDEPLLNKSELHALFVHHAEEDCEKWIPEGQVLLGPDDAAFIEAFRQRPENAMMKHDQAERRNSG